ncbi:hypothetical protein [Jeongeupia naejangsanensis]|uniref:hypothetical protein n=1 Tax=Jeongeupia naejangsanensis TaxID=613195 RepID=UPI001EEF9887|nr:hypothetical protein [Jeongeupia naejangsanensis]
MNYNCPPVTLKDEACMAIAFANEWRLKSMGTISNFTNVIVRSAGGRAAASQMPRQSFRKKGFGG